MEEIKTPEALIWAISTDMAGTPHERKVYFIAITDGDRKLNVTLTTHPAKNAVQADVYVAPDHSYTIHDGCDHERDRCVLDDPDFEESAYGPQPGVIYQEVREGYKKAGEA